MFRAEVLRKIKGYPISEETRRCEDYELFMRLHKAGYRGYNLQEPLIRYREDEHTYRKRTIQSRMQEVKIRYRGFRQLGILRPETADVCDASAGSRAVSANGFKPGSGKVRERGIVSINMQRRYEQYREILKKSELLEYPVKRLLEADQTIAGHKCQIHEQTSYYVLAPALNGFVVWVLQNAVKSGIERLYFLARDGYFMYRIAQRYCEELCLPVECVYLCCSRYSLRIPTYHTDMEEALSYICRGGIDVTLQKILDRSGLTWEEQKNVRTQLELPHEFLEDPDAVIP